MFSAKATKRLKTSAPVSPDELITNITSVVRKLQYVTGVGVGGGGANEEVGKVLMIAGVDVVTTPTEVDVKCCAIEALDDGLGVGSIVLALDDTGAQKYSSINSASKMPCPWLQAASSVSRANMSEG